MKQEVTVELAGGKRITFETGRIAKQASGAALTTSGDTVVLGTAVASPEPKEGIDFFPLTVEYREFTYAGGRIPGGFIKREGRPSEREILTSRQIDRPVRPMFQEGFKCETQVIAFCLSGLFAGVAGGLAAINFEIANAATFGAAQSGSVLLATYIGGVGPYRQICNDVAAKGYEGFALTVVERQRAAAAS